MWGIDYMKTKIIYISGNEVFEMSEIRAAFDEVRNALGLDNDTILFGVPVDCDNALTETNIVENSTPTAAVPEIKEEIADTQIENSEPDPIEEIPEPIVATISETENIEAPQEEAEKVIPILSILAGSATTQDNTEGAPEESDEVSEEVEDVSDANPVSEEDIPTESNNEDTQPVITEINITSEISAPVIDEATVDVEKTTIGNMIEEPAPVEKQEKTIEELLESMKPLREDLTNDDDNTITDNIAITDTDDFLDAETDATLEKLASEFALNEDKIVVPEKSQPQGKIGKLKNILPFKKAKRDDNSLMGDLFGWAGIAANDDDFAIPGFFANAGQKK